MLEIPSQHVTFQSKGHAHNTVYIKIYFPFMYLLGECLN